MEIEIRKQLNDKSTINKMKKILVKIYEWCMNHIKNPLKRFYDLHLNSHNYSLIKTIVGDFEVIKQISPAQWIYSELPETFQYQKESGGKYLFYERDMLLMKGAVVSDKTDMVLIGNKCYWEKTFRSDFPAMIPKDCILLKYNEDQVVVRDFSKVVTIPGKVISLLGVHANIWAHFIIQFLPKLYYAGDNGYLAEPVTILTPVYSDPHLRIILNDYVQNFSKVKLIEAKPNVGYQCESLLYIPSLSVLTDHSNYMLPSMAQFTPEVGGMLKKHLIDAFVSKLSEKDNVNEHQKIYIIRRGTYRSMDNYMEIEQLFSSLGFKLVDPGKLDFLEKVRLFYNADIIAGPMCSGFMNVLFCKSGTKVLEFTPLSRTLGPYMTFIKSVTGVDLLFVTGRDHEATAQTGFHISVEKVKAAYEELMSR